MDAVPTPRVTVCNRPRHAVAPLALALLMAGLGACAARERDAPGAQDGLHGATLVEPQPKPAFTLVDTEGKPFDFRRETDGYLTFLFFGYTHCPDICPIHMANLAAVLKNVDVESRDRVKVVFVTTDPARDSGTVIRAWLDNFDATFIGLTGPDSAIAAAQRGAGLPPAVREDTGAADYAVGHAAFVIAYTPDNMARVLYPSGTRQRDWASDIPVLLSRWSG